MWPTAVQKGLLAVLLWPVLFAISNPINCGGEPSTLSSCPSISEEKLLDRVIQHAELIYRVSEESCSLFVSTIKLIHLNEIKCVQKKVNVVINESLCLSG